MFRFIYEKMVSKRWMVLALLIGNILLTGITCSNAMYGQASLTRTLTRNLESSMEITGKYPGLAGYNINGSSKNRDLIFKSEALAEKVPDAFGLPLIEQVNHYTALSGDLEREVERSTSLREVTLGTLSDFKSHAEIVSGEMYADTLSEDGTVDVLVSENGLVNMNLVLGEKLIFPELVLESGKPLSARICGVFRNNAEADPYWVRTPDSFIKEVLMSEEVFKELFLTEGGLEASLSGQFSALMDYTAMRGDMATRMLEIAKDLRATGENAIVFKENFSTVLTEFLPTEKKVNVTLWVLQVPVFVLLAAFIFMVSRQMLDMEQNEIAVIKSRGASRGQILMIYLLQSLIVATVSLVLGVPLGIFLMQVLGSANAFMEFVQRSALPVFLSGQVILFTLAAALLSVAAMVLPVIRHSKVTIVSHKQKKHRKSDAPFWKKIFLDVVLLGVSIYGLYTYNGQRDQLAQRVQDGASLDPLLYISSSLFMIGAGLFALRIIPAISYLVFRLFRKHWSPALYAALLRVIRTRHSQGFIMVFLVLTISLGIFNAQAARTINSNEEENIAYGVGADLVLQERWNSNREQVVKAKAANPNSTMEIVYEEPDYGVYTTMEGVKSCTKVFVSRTATTSVGGTTISNVRLMGIHTKTFGETAWFKDGLLPHHFYDYLNAMASNPRAVLLSSNFRDNFGCKLGDPISYNDSEGHLMRGIIYGFVDYWPTFSPKGYKRVSDGTYSQVDNYLIVANLAQLQANWGVMPYQVWIDAEDSTSFIYDYAEENGLYYSTFEDASAEIVELKNDPVFQGTNGILTVGFIVVLLLCAVGFLIYWILSIQSRALQFGIFRAMGMSMGEIVTMLVGEQIFISATSIATGVLVGVLTSKLYMPFIQMAYAAYDSALPLRVVTDPSDMIRLAVVIGLMVIVCMGILGWLISKMKIAQVLKLGED